jgi:hypothetical protein
MFLFQENSMNEYSSFVDLHDRVMNSTGNDLGPVEEINLIDSSSVGTLITPAHSELNSKDQDEGSSESNMNAPAHSELDNKDRGEGASESNLNAPAHSEPNNKDRDEGASESNFNDGVITVMGKLKHS